MSLEDLREIMSEEDLMLFNGYVSLLTSCFSREIAQGGTMEEMHKRNRAMMPFVYDRIHGLRAAMEEAWRTAEANAGIEAMESTEQSETIPPEH